MKKFLRRLAFKTCVWIVLPLLVAAGLYAWWAKSRLDQVAGDGWTLGGIAVVAPAESEVKTSLPRVLRVAVKRPDGANYRPHRDGVAADVLDWSPAAGEWSSVPMTLAEEAESLRLRGYGVLLPGDLIERLGEEDQRRREVAFALLRARTGQDFGYRHDRPPASQAAAIAQWRSWWEKNKLTWTVEKGLDAVLKRGGGKQE